jgi:hypothetical protein
MKVQTFRCYGGPLAGLDVTEQYAGEDYLRYNAAPSNEKIELFRGSGTWATIRYGRKELGKENVVILER